MWTRFSASLRDAASATISSIRPSAFFSSSFAAFFSSSVCCGSGEGWVPRRWRGVCADGDETSDNTMMTVRMDEKTLRDFKVITTSWGKWVRSHAFRRKGQLQIHSAMPSDCGLKAGLRTALFILSGRRDRHEGSLGNARPPPPNNYHSKSRASPTPSKTSLKQLSALIRRIKLRLFILRLFLGA